MEKKQGSQESESSQHEKFLVFAVECPRRQACNVCDAPEVTGGCNQAECPDFKRN